MHRLGRMARLKSVVYLYILLIVFQWEKRLLGAQSQESNTFGQMFDKYNQQLWHFKRAGALVAWNLSTEMSPKYLEENEQLSIKSNIWNNQWCSQFIDVYNKQNLRNFRSKHWTPEQFRQVYLICRGPRFSSYQLSTMQSLYNDKICLDGECYRMEPDLNRFMETSRDEKKLKKAWIAWHGKIGVEVKPLYVNLVQMLNQGARQAGLEDMGQCWRQESEIGDLPTVAKNLYADVKYLFSLLHSFVRFKLEEFYKIKLYNGPIPAHLLGNMWAQKWDSLIDIVWPEMGEPTSEKNPLVKSLLLPNSSVINMVEEAELFFISMGFPALPETFWRNSYFEDEKKEKGGESPGDSGRDSTSRNCHGSAANMFGWPEADYRMMMCAEVNDEDLITIHHEMGHIMYFMAYRHQPAIFQDGANSAFHESVGDAITYGLRSERKDKAPMKNLLRIGLAKLPQIAFGLVMDFWRWEVFRRESGSGSWNDMWWELNEEYLGIRRPDGYPDNADGLDAAGKFHIIDNIPYIRYFMASFLQLQFYEAMCKEAGWEDLHKCQLRGSKDAGRLLWEMMKKGSSQSWQLTLQQMTGTMEIKSEALLKYFHPLKTWLQHQVALHNLTLGW